MALLPTFLLSNSWYFAVILAVLVAYLRSITKWRARARGRPLPPGPPRLPIIGNMMVMPKWKPWLGFRDLSEKYGPIMYMEVFGSPIVVLESPDIMTELLEKRSAKTSERIKTPLIPLAGQAFNLAFMQYGQWWRSHRRMFWQHFQPAKVSDYWPVQREVIRKFLVKLHDTPDDLQRVIQYNVTASTMKITYGFDIDEDEDKWITVVDDAFAGLRVVTISVQFLLEHFPLVRHIPAWFPGAGFQRTLGKARAPSDYMLDVPFAMARENTQGAGPGHPSIVAGILSRFGAQGPDAENEQIAKDVAAIAVEGGSDTTYSTIQGIFLALSLNPEVQRKAQAELDSVVGPHRLPDFEDRDALVYINAIVKESVRWHNVVPLGVGHCLTEDDEFQGYFIPAGTVLVPNVWSVMHNPQIYPDPHKFNPDRFIRDGKLDTSVLDPTSEIFGFGRRICPGRYFADSTLFITVACVLHVFNIGPPLDENGLPIKIELQQSHGFLSYPEDCRCTISPRSSEAVDLIQACALEKAS
ncbi:cytochrome P450 [Cubamyces sp. BRFM 1775]|nr:cytochrome P450 [Cubamyces sp. BRFM 1775]